MAPLNVPPELALPVLGAAVWYLVAAARITYAIRALYPPWITMWAECSACAGTWISAGLALLLNYPVLGHDARSPQAVLLAGLWGMATVPLAAYLLLAALVWLTNTLHPVEPEEDEE